LPQIGNQFLYRLHLPLLFKPLTNQRRHFFSCPPGKLDLISFVDALHFARIDGRQRGNLLFEKCPDRRLLRAGSPRRSGILCLGNRGPFLLRLLQQERPVDEAVQKLSRFFPEQLPIGGVDLGQFIVKSAHGDLFSVDCDERRTAEGTRNQPVGDTGARGDNRQERDRKNDRFSFHVFPFVGPPGAEAAATRMSTRPGCLVPPSFADMDRGVQFVKKGLPMK